MKSKYIYKTDSLKYQVYKRDKGRCQLCQDKLLLSHATLDHIKPKSKGGPTTLDNLQLMCLKCNQFKANKDLYISEEQQEEINDKIGNVI
jgi:5-methylcytosine-specific restriction endonuclease McrA